MKEEEEEEEAVSPEMLAVRDGCETTVFFGVKAKIRCICSVLAKNILKPSKTHADHEATLFWVVLGWCLGW